MKGKTFKLIGSLTLMACLATPLKAQKNADLENIGKRDINSRNSLRINRDIDADLKLGEQLSKELESQVKLSSDPTVLALVDRVTQLIARNSDARIPISAGVIDTSEINVTALPGGRIYVTLELIRTASTESELASAIAYGIAHVAAGHDAGFENFGQLLGFQPMSGSASMFTGGIAGAAIQNGLAIGVPTMFFSLSRSAVEEADFLGIQYLYKAGYDSRAAVEILQKIEALSPAKTEKMSSLFQSHPPLATRIMKIQAAIEKILPPRDNNVVTTAEFEEVHRKLTQ